MNIGELYSRALRECLEETHTTLKCPLVDWSHINVHDLLNKNIRNTIQGEWEAAVFTIPYHQTIWGMVFFNLLGDKVMQIFQVQGKRLRVLDIGCGSSKHFRNMFEGIAGVSPDTLSYVSIDKEPKLNDIAMVSDLNISCDDPMTCCHIRWVLGHTARKHIMMDVFDNTHKFILESGDIMILDIEPHGKEWEVYQKFVPHMNKHHILILKCIGHMSHGFQSKMATDFIEHITECSDLRILETASWFWSEELDYAVLNVYPRDVVLVIERQDM